jgi:hypothetical protein
MADSLISLVEMCCRDLGLVIADLNVDAVVTAKTVYTINGLQDYIPDDKAAEDAFAYVKIATPEWRRVISYGFPTTNNVTVSRDFTGNVNTNDKLDLFFILNPDEVKRCVNEALSELFREERLLITLDPAHTLYDVTTTNTWLLTKGQVQRVGFIYTDPSEANSVQEWAAPAYRWQESADALSIVLGSFPADCTNTKLVVTARRYYSTLTADANTTTCPLPLIRAAAKKAIMQEIWHELDGVRAKQMFGMEMAITEKDLSAARVTWRQNIVLRDPSMEEVYRGPEVPVDQGEWDW